MSPTKRFDPFAFSSDTGFRFFLLIASVLAASAMIYISIFSAGLPWSHQQTNSASLAACNLEKDPFACMAPRLPQVRPWMLGSLAVLFGIACAIYWTYPSWKIRRDRLIPLTVNDARDVVEYIQDLSRRAGLAQAPNRCPSSSPITRFTNT